VSIGPGALGFASLGRANAPVATWPVFMYMGRRCSMSRQILIVDFGLLIDNEGVG
jgi:hypothetical protein